MPTYGFIVYYRLKSLTEEELRKSREDWLRVINESWPTNLRIVGEYRHAWGTEWNGFFVLETEDPEVFFDWWPRFRDRTRWYVDNTRTVIGIKAQ